MRGNSKRSFTEAKIWFVLLSCFAIFQACKEENVSDFSLQKTEMVSRVGEDIILPQLAKFEQELETLKQNIQNDQIELAKEQFVVVMQEWQVMEMVQIGSLASSLNSEFGNDVRDEIYSWPTINYCRIDQETVLENWNTADFFTEQLVNVYGLDTLEYLLFAELDSVCPPQVAPISDGSWAALSSDDIRQRRNEYALRIIEHIDENLSIITEEWEQNAITWTVDEGMEAIFQTLFYLESHSKERKLVAVMEGEAPETPFVGDSLLWIVQNLRGFETLFFFNDNVGFDDLLIENGFAGLVTDIRNELETSRVLIEELRQAETSSLPEIMADEPEKTEQLIESLAKISRILREDVSILLQLEIPAEVAGDND